LLPEDQKALALRISRGFEGEGRAGELEAAEWQRIRATEGEDAAMEHFAKISRAGKERVLRTMDQNQQADYIRKLGTSSNPMISRAAGEANEIIRTEFSLQQRTALNVANANLLTKDDQVEWLNSATTSDQERAMFLLSKNPDDQDDYIDKLDAKYKGRGAEVRKSIEDYFTQEQLDKYRAARYLRARDDDERLARFQEIVTQRGQEMLITNLSTDDRFKLLKTLKEHPTTKGAGIDYGIEATMENLLSPHAFAEVAAKRHLALSDDPLELQADFDKRLAKNPNGLFVREALKLLKTPEEKAKYLDNLDRSNTARTNEVEKAHKIVASRDEQDDLWVYETGRTDEATQRIKLQEAISEKNDRRIAKLLRSAQKGNRAQMIKRLTNDGADGAVTEIIRKVGTSRLTQAERDDINHWLTQIGCTSFTATPFSPASSELFP